jgi:hypothetical protein
MKFYEMLTVYNQNFILILNKFSFLLSYNVVSIQIKYSLNRLDAIQINKIRLDLK